MITLVIPFTPVEQAHCPDDFGQEVLYYFGAVDCPQCARRTPVSAPVGETVQTYCLYCRSPIPVAVEGEPHLRLDDSRPAESGHGCICGSPDCPWWLAV